MSNPKRKYVQINNDTKIKLRSSSKKYLKAIEFIALNDEPDEMALDYVKQQLTVVLTSETFSILPEHVANDVLDYRSWYALDGSQR